MAQQLPLPSNRTLSYHVSGAKDGFPLIWIHGTPGSYYPVPGIPEKCASKGIKFISYSRSGYGGSSRNKGRSVVDDVEDLKVLKEHLKVEKCFVGGWSGGGPHAIACAARLPGCVAALCVAGVAPYEAEGLDWLAGQGEDNVQEFHAAMEGEPSLQKFCGAQRPELLEADAAGIINAMSSLLPDVDKKAITDNPDLGQHMIDSFHEGLKDNVDGWVDDSLAFIKSWGFELEEVKVPVLLYQGSEDKMVPFAHGQWLGDHLPQKVLRKHLVQGEGHLSIFLGNAEKMLDELLEMAKE